MLSVLRYSGSFHAGDVPLCEMEKKDRDFQFPARHCFRRRSVSSHQWYSSSVQVIRDSWGRSPLHAATHSTRPGRHSSARYIVADTTYSAVLIDKAVLQPGSVQVPRGLFRISHFLRFVLAAPEVSESRFCQSGMPQAYCSLFIGFWPAATRRGCVQKATQTVRYFRRRNNRIPLFDGRLLP